MVEGSRPSLTSEDELYHLAELTDLHSQTTLSSKILVNAVVLHLLSGFVEFVLKELVKLVDPDSPPFEGSACSFQNHLIDPLEAKGIFTRFPQDYVENVQNHRKTVRNRFSHGDWEKLATNVGAVDLDNALSATAIFVSGMQSKLEEKGFDLSTPSIVRAAQDKT